MGNPTESEPGPGAMGERDPTVPSEDQLLEDALGALEGEAGEPDRGAGGTDDPDLRTPLPKTAPIPLAGPVRVTVADRVTPAPAPRPAVAPATPPPSGPDPAAAPPAVAPAGSAAHRSTLSGLRDNPPAAGAKGNETRRSVREALGAGPPAAGVARAPDPVTLAEPPKTGAGPGPRGGGSRRPGRWVFASVLLGGFAGAAAALAVAQWVVLPRFGPVGVEGGRAPGGRSGSAPPPEAPGSGGGFGGHSVESGGPGAPAAPLPAAWGALTERDRELLDSLAEQLGRLERRNWIGGLADRAIVTGSRDAYRALAAAAGEDAEFAELAEGIRAELFKVERFYTSGNRLGGYVIPVAELMAGRGFDSESELTARDLVSVLLDHDSVPWMARGRAAWLLGRKKDPGTVEDLVTAIRTEPHLDVLKECVYTFEELTGYRAERVFDTDGLLDWWEENRAGGGAEAPGAPADGDR